MDYKEVLKNMLPEGLLDCFELNEMKLLPATDHELERYVIVLFEKNELPVGLKEEDYESKGFYKPRLIQDFPLRGKPVYLELHRRRWRNKQDKKDIHRDFTLLAEGTKFTKELSDFLKSAY